VAFGLLELWILHTFCRQWESKDSSTVRGLNIYGLFAAGAGKTNVAMLCIMHELGMHRKADGSIDTAAFKIVYVAPMKALVAEMVGNFSTRLGEAYGLKVRELTGKWAWHAVMALCGWE
jgi:pre-mRNA-splicing helicase BRR2